MKISMILDLIMTIPSVLTCCLQISFVHVARQLARGRRVFDVKHRGKRALHVESSVSNAAALQLS